MRTPFKFTSARDGYNGVPIEGVTLSLRPVGSWYTRGEDGEATVTGTVPDPIVLYTSAAGSETVTSVQTGMYGIVGQDLWVEAAGEVVEYGEIEVSTGVWRRWANVVAVGQEDIPPIDQTVIEGSANPVSGGGVMAYVQSHLKNTYSSLADLIAADLAGENKVGSYAWTASYYGIPTNVDDWAKGGNCYVLMDGGGSRPDEDGGHIIHIGEAGLYRKGIFLTGVDICQFGADGLGLESNLSDNTAFIQSAINYVEFTGRELKIPKSPKPYDCLGQIVFTMGNNPASNNAAKFTSTALTIVGENSTGGVFRAWKGSVIRYIGPPGIIFIDIKYDTYASEGHKFYDLVFACEANSRLGTTGIRMKQSGVSSVYPRQQVIDSCGFDGFDIPLLIEGDTSISVVNTLNYFGPIELRKVHTWDSLTGIKVNHAVLNLFTATNCLFHNCADYGIDTEYAAINLSLSNTHFEGCIKGCHKLGAFQTDIQHNNVSAESCGELYTGFFDVPSSPMATRLTITSQLYAFSFMPRTIHLGRNCHIDSSSGVIDVSGWGWTTSTPDNIRVVPFEYSDINDVDAANTDISYACDITSAIRIAGNGNDIYPAELPGSVFTEDNNGMSTQLQKVLVGAADKKPMHTGTDWVVPGEGYVYLTFYAEATNESGLNGVVTATSWPIDGVQPLDIQKGNTHTQRKGTFIICRKVTSGTMTSVRFETNYDYATLGSLVYSEHPLKITELASGCVRTWLP